MSDRVESERWKSSDWPLHSIRAHWTSSKGWTTRHTGWFSRQLPKGKHSLTRTNSSCFGCDRARTLLMTAMAVAIISGYVQILECLSIGAEDWLRVIIVVYWLNRLLSVSNVKWAMLLCLLCKWACSSGTQSCIFESILKWFLLKKALAFVEVSHWFKRGMFLGARISQIILNRRLGRHSFSSANLAHSLRLSRRWSKGIILLHIVLNKWLGIMPLLSHHWYIRKRTRRARQLFSFYFFFLLVKVICRKWSDRRGSFSVWWALVVCRERVWEVLML